MIFLKHHSVTSVSINQTKVMHPASLTPDVAFKKNSLKIIPWKFSSLQMSHFYSLLGPAINIFLLQIWHFYLLSLTVRQAHKLGFENNVKNLFLIFSLLCSLFVSHCLYLLYSGMLDMFLSFRCFLLSNQVPKCKCKLHEFGNIYMNFKFLVYEH